LDQLESSVSESESNEENVYNPMKEAKKVELEDRKIQKE
jgi:hypothetical protein